MGNYGIKISEQGHDVKTAEDIDLILKTDFTLLKVAAAGTVNISAGAGQVTHNLGYKPQFLVYALTHYGTDPDHVSFMNTSDFNFEFTGVTAVVDNTKLYLYTDAYVVSCYYFIFYEGI